MSKHVTFGSIPNEEPLTNSKDKQYISESLKRIQNMVKIQNAENFLFTNERSIELAGILESSLSKNDDMALSIEVDQKKFKEVYNELSPILISQHPIIKKFLDIILSNELEQMAEELMWIVVYDTLQNRALNKYLSQSRADLYNLLSINFSSLRRRLALLPAWAYDQILEFYCAQICAVILILLLHSHQETELYSNVPFVGHIENGVRLLLIGFSSPNLNSFHTIVFDLIPKNLQPSVPTKMVIGGDKYNSDLANTLSYEPQIQNEWNSRRKCLFHATSQTGLLSNALKLRGSAAPKPVSKSHRVIRGSVGKSDLPIRKAMNIIQSVDDIVDSHVDATKNDLDKLKNYEKEYLTSPRWAILSNTFPNLNQSSSMPNISPKPLDVSFDHFQPDVSLPGVFQELARSPRRYNIDNMPPRQKRIIDVDEMKSYLEDARVELHEELRDSQNAYRKKG
ncbi:hypothetical protein M9Y10_005825 [Tritrichomonas musculus]|uniref:Uncharacterized protein n=1 Tax=Tritrichomonas musculus TaxID=1915356 RepID=A0ABR2JCM5_9EUKA